MTGKRKAAGVGILCAVLTVTGCQHTTETVIVTPKNAIAGAKMLGENTAGNVKEQVQAPENCALDFSNENGCLSVHVDAEVTVPDVEGIRLKKVETQVFHQSDMDNIQENLLQGNPVWQRVYTREQRDTMAEWTKDEIQESIDQLVRDKEKIEAMTDEYGWGSGIWENQFTWLCDLKENAPDAFETKTVETKVLYSREDAEKFYTEEEFPQNSNVIWGGVTIGGQNYNFFLNNNWADMFKCAGVYLIRGKYAEFGEWDFYASKEDYGMYSADEEETEEEGNPQEIQEQRKEEGDALLQSLGLEGMELAACETYVQQENCMLIPRTAVNLIYTRVVDGVPVTYTESRYMLNRAVQDYSERFEAAWDEEGLAQVIWENPAKIYDMSDEYVFLLPFSDILKTFQENVSEGQEMDDEKQMELYRKEIRITSIRLGYMWVPDTATEMEGMLIPVWDFMGDYIIWWPDSEEKGIEGGSSSGTSMYQSFLTINAMDGTIVEGYIRPN